MSQYDNVELTFGDCIPDYVQVGFGLWRPVFQAQGHVSCGHNSKHCLCPMFLQIFKCAANKYAIKSLYIITLLVLRGHESILCLESMCGSCRTDILASLHFILMHLSIGSVCRESFAKA